MQRYDVVVVGGGAMGSATAYALARRGDSVALLEQFGHGHTRGSSHGPSRIFRLAYAQAHFVPLALEAQRRWRELEDDVQTPLLTVTGGIDHGSPEALAAVEAGLDAVGVASERLPATEAERRWPGMRFEGDVLFQSDAGRVDADATVSALQRRAAELGALVADDDPVVELRAATSGVEVVTASAVLEAGVVVLAAGAWLPRFATRLGLSVPPLRVTQEQPAYFSGPPSADAWPVFVHHGDAPHYGLFTPGLGVKVGEHGTGVVVDPDARPPADADRVARLSPYVASWLPGAVPEPTRVDTCLYTSTPDEEFVLSRQGRIVVCSACSGHGFKFVPAIGARIADLALSN